MSLDHESKNKMMCYEFEPWALTLFCVNMGIFWALEEILPKIHDSVDLVQVANKIKSCDVKKFVLNSL